MELAEGAAPADAWTQLRAIIESLADGIVIVDRSGVIRFANPAAARMFARNPDELVGTPLGTPLVAGETTEMEIVRRGGGELVYAELRVVDTEWEGETAELVSLRDVTDRKYAEERSRQLAHEREARLAAEASSRAKSDFLAIMSHELRTPLNAILGYSEIIELGISGELSDKMRDHVTRIRRSARHLLGLVNDILDLAKVEAGRLGVESAPGLPSDAITSALSLVQPQAHAKNLALIVTREAEGLPRFMGDSERVRQIIVNLLSNAVKCTDAGGTITVDGAVTSTPDARARLQPRSAHIRLTVRDTGSGIAADKLKSIFEPFVQAESGHTRSRDGSGLGLTIGQRLARAMGGDITVESEVGKGSAFSLWLPVDDTHGSSSASEHAAESAGDSPATNAGERQVRRAPAPPRAVKGLGKVADGILSHLTPLVDGVVERIRCDGAIPMAKGLRTSQVSDHLTTLFADIAGALLVVEEADGEPSALLADAMEIQRLVSERHGTQRARLSFTETAMRREFMIIREELEHVARRAMPNADMLQAADVMATVSRFVDQSEYLAVRAMEQATES
ncbi:MAG: sensor protein [Gemmatimonadetes bacterium]|nr:sensor protein [Gemmatimonadota bacterium]